MIDQLPRRGEVATEFRSLASNVSDEVFSSVFPNIYRLLKDNQEMSEKAFSESISGARSIELQVNNIDNSLNEMNFELEKLKNYQNASLNLLEGLKDSVDGAPGPGALLGKLIGKIFQGARKAAAKKDAKKVDKAKEKEKFRKKFRTKNKLLNAILTVLDVYQILSDLQPEIEKIEKIPEKKNTKNKNVLNFLEKNTTSSDSILPSNKLISDNTKPDLKQTAPVLSAVNIGSKNPGAVMDDDVTAAKDIIFGVRKMKFVGDRVFFTNIIGVGTDKNGKLTPFKEPKQENRTSANIEELKKKSEGTTGEGSGQTTPGSGEAGGGSTPSSGGGGSTGSGSGGSTGGGGEIKFNEGPQGPAFTGSQQEAFKKIEDAARAAGSPDPKVTASIAMLESGYLTSRMARGNNPFGQTITRSQIGSNGIVGGTVGADGQLHAIYDSLESAVKHHVSKWGGRYKGDAKETLRNLVGGGYNTVNPAWAPSVYSIYRRNAGSEGPVAQNDNRSGAPSSMPPQQDTAAAATTAEQPAISPVLSPQSTTGTRLNGASASLTSTPRENAEETRERLQQIITNNNNQTTINRQSQTVVTRDGSPAVAEVSVRQRLIESFSNP